MVLPPPRAVTGRGRRTCQVRGRVCRARARVVRRLWGVWPGHWKLGARGGAVVFQVTGPCQDRVTGSAGPPPGRSNQETRVPGRFDRGRQQQPRFHPSGVGGDKTLQRNRRPGRKPALQFKGRATSYRLDLNETEACPKKLEMRRMAMAAIGATWETVALILAAPWIARVAGSQIISLAPKKLAVSPKDDRMRHCLGGSMTIEPRLAAALSRRWNSDSPTALLQWRWFVHVRGVTDVSLTWEIRPQCGC